MKIVGVMDEDPFDSRTWSGSSRYFFGALRDKGVLAGAVSAELSPWSKAVYKAISIQSSMDAWRFKFNLHTRYYAALTQQAARKIRDIGDAYDVVLQVGAWYDLPATTDRPVCSYHDGSLATLIKSPYPHPRISKSHILRTLSYERELYAKMRFIFPMSNWLASSFIKDNGISTDRVHPVGAGINLPKIRSTDRRNHDVPNILFVGKDFVRKGGPDLLKAFAIVRKSFPGARLTIVGPMIGNPPDGVRCVGFLSKSDPIQLEKLLDEYEQASMFVMPSLYEPFGIAFAEAMAHRLPCIGTNVCAMPEIIDHDRTGYIVPPGDPEALARRMLDLLVDTDRCRKFGEEGYRKYESSYTWHAVVDKICNVIETM